MVVTKKDAEPKANSPKVEPKAAQRAKKVEQGQKAFVYDGPESFVTLSVGGSNYDFRKGEPVYLSPGQSPNHPEVHEVKE
jgi:hypothetical protein